MQKMRGMSMKPTQDTFKVLIYESEAQKMAEYVAQYPSIETGGDLFGYWTHSGAPVVMYVLGPGPCSQHHYTSFYQDPDYLHDVGTALYHTHGLQHVGEWHSHHRLGLNEPSSGDIQTVRRGIQRQRWDRFLLTICTFSSVRETMVWENYFLFIADTAEPQPMRIEKLPGISPFRPYVQDFDSKGEPKQRGRRYATWSPGPATPQTVNSQVPVQCDFQHAWFSMPKGQEKLKQIVQSFAKHGISCRMLTANNGYAIKLLLPEVELLLPDNFPHDPPICLYSPRWKGTIQPWTANTDMLQLYRNLLSGEMFDHNDELQTKREETRAIVCVDDFFVEAGSKTSSIAVETSLDGSGEVLYNTVEPFSSCEKNQNALLFDEVLPTTVPSPSAISTDAEDSANIKNDTEIQSSQQIESMETQPQDNSVAERRLSYNEAFEDVFDKKSEFLQEIDFSKTNREEEFFVQEDSASSHLKT